MNINKRKSLLLAGIAATTLLVGCKKEKITNVTEEPATIEDLSVTIGEEIEEEEINKEENKKEENEKEESEKEESEKEENKVLDNKTDDKTTQNSNSNNEQNNNVNKDKEDSNKSESEKVESNTNKENSNKKPENTTSQEDDKVSNNDNVVLVSNPTFTKSEITESLKSRMLGKSMKENDSISFDDLSYLTITYLDYNGKTQQGEMVVHKKLADEVLAIFKDIYYAKFPIERMRLIDDYNAVDHTSMVNNNSSAFCYRTIAGTNKVSNHGMGMAIDINPFYNPHVLKSSGTVNPVEASKYANRSLNAKGMIKANDAVYKAFTSRGWTWGGHWKNPDYQHFEKKV